MKVPFQQSQPFGCGMYVLANCFNDQSFLNFITSAGMRISDQNRILYNLGYKVTLNSLIVYNCNIPSFKPLDDTSIFKINWNEGPEHDAFRSDHCRPLFVTTKKVLHHTFLVIQMFDQDDWLWVIDSNWHEIRWVNIDDFIKEYPTIVAVDVLEYWDRCDTGGIGSVDNFYFTKKQVSHLIKYDAV